MRRGLNFGIFVVAALLVVGCGDSAPPFQFFADGSPSDADAGFIPPPADAVVTGDLASQAGAPVITILSPAENDLVIGATVVVRAEVVPNPEGGDAVKEVLVSYQGGTPQKATLSPTGGSSEYEATVQLGDVDGTATIVVSATDINDRLSEAKVTFNRDFGPTIIFNSPTDGQSAKGSVAVNISVIEDNQLTDFSVRVGSVVLNPQPTVQNQNGFQTIYGGQLVFDSAQFVPPLSGDQILVAEATNGNGARTVAQVGFRVDNAGPTLVANSPGVGSLIGGIVPLSVNVTDPAGVIPGSVVAVISNNLQQATIPLTDAGGGNFTGQFDASVLVDDFIFPIVSFRAQDTLGNEAHIEYLVELDNGPPIVSMDPPSDNYYDGRFNSDDELICSTSYDPVGEDAASDLTRVPQLIPLRVRVQDQGNLVPSAPWVPVAGVDQSKTRLLLLSDLTRPLVIDTTGDGFCDSINPEVEPGTPTPNDAVGVNLGPIAPKGSANFGPAIPSPSPAPFPCKAQPVHPPAEPADADADPPVLLCSDVTPMTRVTGETTPRIYAVPPIAGDTQSLNCVGTPFDLAAAGFTGGWICAAVEARDGNGNIGISKPMRIFFDPNKTTAFAGPLQGGEGAPPDCTGTLTGGTVTQTPCAFKPWDSDQGPNPIKYPQEFAPFTINLP